MWLAFDKGIFFNSVSPRRDGCHQNGSAQPSPRLCPVVGPLTAREHSCQWPIRLPTLPKRLLLSPSTFEEQPAPGDYGLQRNQTLATDEKPSRVMSQRPYCMPGRCRDVVGHIVQREALPVEDWREVNVNHVAGSSHLEKEFRITQFPNFRSAFQPGCWATPCASWWPTSRMSL